MDPPPMGRPPGARLRLIAGFIAAERGADPWGPGGLSAGGCETGRVGGGGDLGPRAAMWGRVPGSTALLWIGSGQEAGPLPSWGILV